MSSSHALANLANLIVGVLPAAGIWLKQPFDSLEALEAIDSIEANQTYFREFQPAPDGGWEALAPSNRPTWWRPEGSVLPPHGSKIALAFRGDYHRWTKNGFDNGHSDGKACSDYWASNDNIYATIVAPLKAARAQLRFYFHTYNDLVCPRYDDKLVEDMKPTQFKFDESYPNKLDIAYTFREVLGLVFADEWADFVLLLRFDVQYNAPITSWNMDWQAVNVPFSHRHTPEINSDLFITIPRAAFQNFMFGLQNYTGPSDGLPGPRYNHFRAHMYIKLYPGIQAVHAIQPDDHTDRDSLPYSFCGIVRECSADYDSCVAR